MVTSKDLAWAAGIIEGEGHISPNACITVTQKEPWLVYRLQKLFGGTVGVNKRGAYGDYPRWTLSTRDAVGLLMSIYLFLSPHKKLQARNALAAWKQRRFRQRGQNGNGNGH